MISMATLLSCDMPKMIVRLPGRTLPRETRGEAAPRRAKPLHERAVVRQTREDFGERASVAMGNEKPGLLIPHGLPQPWRVRRHDRRGARGRFEVRDAPPFLGRRERQGPRLPEQGQFLLIGDEPKKPNAVTEVKRARKR